MSINKLYVIGLIPARGGSKSVKNKNIKLLHGKPLIYYTIEQSLSCNLIDETVVSTDSNEIADISKSYGATVPFLRPKEISGDLSTDYEFFDHYISFLKNNDKKLPDLIVQLRPTCPERKVHHIQDSLKLMIQNIDNYDSLRSVVEFEKSPFKMYTIDKNRLIPLFKNIYGSEPYNMCRQSLPQAYLHNGYIDIVKTSTIVDKKSVTGDKIYPYIMDRTDTIDIDTQKDWDSCVDNMQK